MMVMWLVATLAAGGASVDAHVAAPPAMPPRAGRVAVSPVGPALVPARADRIAPSAATISSQRLSALAIPTSDNTPPTPFSFSAVEDDRQRLRLGVKPGLRRARFGLDYRVALDR